MDADYYGVLGVSETANQPEIRRAYLRLIQTLHPDRNPHPEAGPRAAEINEAYAVLSDPWKRALYDAQRQEPANPPASSRASWVRPTVAAALALCGLVAWGVYAAATAPAGSDTNAAPAGAETNASVDAARTRVASLIDQLAGIVSARAPAAGTHLERGTIVTDRAIDRSKFDSRELENIADAIQRELRESPDTDGFIASAYFNARLFAASVELIARVARGEAIAEQTAEVRALNDVEAVRRWLNGSRFASAYVDLVDRLARSVEQYQPGRPSAEMEADLKSRNAVLDHLRTLMDADTLSGRTDSYNARAAIHNRLAEEARLVAETLDARATLVRQLDLAFNRALDPALLFGNR